MIKIYETYERTQFGMYDTIVFHDIEKGKMLWCENLGGIPTILQIAVFNEDVEKIKEILESSKNWEEERKLMDEFKLIMEI